MKFKQLANEEERIIRVMVNGQPESAKAVSHGYTRNLKRVEVDKREMKRLLKQPPPESVRSALTMLTDNQKQVSILKWAHDWSVARIARAMNKDRKTITETLERARTKMNVGGRNTRSAKRVATDRERHELEDELIDKIDREKHHEES